MLSVSYSFNEYECDYECSPTARREREAAWEDALEAMEHVTPPMAERQLAKRDLNSPEAPGAPEKLFVRMSSLEEGEIWEGGEEAEEGEESLEPHRGVATRLDFEIETRIAMRKRKERLDGPPESYQYWNWEPKQARFVKA